MMTLVTGETREKVTARKTTERKKLLCRSALRLGGRDGWSSQQHGETAAENLPSSRTQRWHVLSGWVCERACVCVCVPVQLSRADTKHPSSSSSSFPSFIHCQLLLSVYRWLLVPAVSDSTDGECVYYPVLCVCVCVCSVVMGDESQPCPSINQPRPLNVGPCVQIYSHARMHTRKLHVQSILKSNLHCMKFTQIATRHIWIVNQPK